jgi:hypothetical protein
MANSDFEKWLKQGLGRAAAFVQAKDPVQYQDALLHACTHNRGLRTPASHPQQTPASGVDLVDHSQEIVCLQPRPQ